jgi:hypothetical protein
VVFLEDLEDLKKDMVVVVVDRLFEGRADCFGFGDLKVLFVSEEKKVVGIDGLFYTFSERLIRSANLSTFKAPHTDAFLFEHGPLVRLASLVLSPQFIFPKKMSKKDRLTTKCLISRQTGP